eukprot:CAMPEP_0201551890 /NCGR_PEP_ID=MMETSP0173_2-20130828/12120_1 /ASSEMBLY_ACC=CAM_ASM_000268 /TAXON_ID=218659 /ORGANISM="Vexillifera sp., Strain DIVA3 564/2" /LENGTH=265 /DNA_ID=CAMNT_0047962249 /DNA_START=29 /DNA_END=823 /DNA_ORIENTATION=+
MSSTSNEKSSNQVGGHAGAFKSKGDGVIQKKANDRELEFYTKTLPKHPALQELVPKFHGIENNDGIDYVSMEDLTFGFEQPCVLDVKLGTTSVDQTCSAAKIERINKKDQESTTAKIGMRITGMKVVRKNGEVIKRDKEWGRTVTEEGTFDALKVFFYDGERIRHELLKDLLVDLKKIRTYMCAQTDLQFISSSVLMVYDAADLTKPVRTRMIDFAHVWPTKQFDEGYILGIRKLIGYLEVMELLAKTEALDLTASNKETEATKN